MLDCYFSIDSVLLIHLEIVCLLQIGTACLETFGFPLSVSQGETQEYRKGHLIVCTYLHPAVIEKHLGLIHLPAVHQQPLLCLPEEAAEVVIVSSSLVFVHRSHLLGNLDGTSTALGPGSQFSKTLRCA